VKINNELHLTLKRLMSELVSDRDRWKPHWEDIARMYLPRRYSWLTSSRAVNGLERNKFILDPTGTFSARTLASGMMNGITSPARPWINLGAKGYDLAEHRELAINLQQRESILYSIFAESNFYSAISTLYLDLVLFGSAAMLVYDDDQAIIRCYNSALGEFFFSQSHRLQVDIFAREFNLNVAQIVARWGIDNVSTGIRTAFETPTGGKLTSHTIVHLIEPNKDDGLVAKTFKYREVYWERGGESGTILAANGFHELIGAFARWETIGNDNYGSSPAMDNYPDVVQLQAETKNKAQGLDKMVRPPMLADIQLQNKPSALVPHGITYVSGINSVGMKPIHEVRLPIAELSNDILSIQQRIGRGFHNDLFRMISNLDTVRSATEISGLKEEKLVLLGPVLQRFEVEVLNPIILRTLALAKRRGVLPDYPEQYQDIEVEISYNSVLSVAQKAFNTVPTERYLQFIGEVAPIYPEAVNVPNMDNILLNYGNALGLAADEMNSPEDIAAAKAQQQQAAGDQSQLDQGSQIVDSAAALSQTDVGGGVNALQQLLGN